MPCAICDVRATRAMCQCLCVLTQFNVYFWGKTETVALFRFFVMPNEIAFMFYIMARLKVRCKRVSIRQLIWAFFPTKTQRKKKNTFLFAFSCSSDFRWLAAIWFYYCIGEWGTRASISRLVHFEARTAIPLISNRYGRSYKSVWFLFRIPFLLPVWPLFSLTLFFFSHRKKSGATAEAFYILFMYKPKYVQFYNNFFDASVNKRSLCVANSCVQSVSVRLRNLFFL